MPMNQNQFGTLWAGSNIEVLDLLQSPDDYTGEDVSKGNNIRND